MLKRIIATCLNVVNGTFPIKREIFRKTVQCDENVKYVLPTDCVSNLYKMSDAESAKPLHDAVQGLPGSDLMYKIMSYVDPDELVGALSLSNKDWWEIYRQIKPGTKWNKNVDWIHYTLPTEYLYVPDKMLCGSVSDLPDEEKKYWNDTPGLYKFQLYEHGGVWKKQGAVDTIDLLEVQTNYNIPVFLRGFDNKSGKVFDTSDFESQNIRHILKETAKILRIRPHGYDEMNGILLGKNHQYPLLFYLTKLPKDVNISLTSRKHKGNQVIWKVLDENGFPIGRAVGTNFLHYMATKPLRVGIGFLFNDDYDVVKFGNWHISETDMIYLLENPTFLFYDKEKHHKKEMILN